MNYTNTVIRHCTACHNEGDEDVNFTYQYPANFWSCNVCGSKNTIIREVIEPEDETEGEE